MARGQGKLPDLSSKYVYHLTRALNCLDRRDWINSFFVIPDECANLNNIGTVTVDVLYDTSISTTGNIE